MNSQTNEKMDESQVKHIALDNAIESINDVIDHVKQILNKINGEDSSLQQLKHEEIPNWPSLHNVLCEGPARIRDACQQAHEQLEKIESNLF